MEYSKALQDVVRSLHEAGRNYSQIAVTIAVGFGYALPVAHRIVDAVLHHDGNHCRLYRFSPDEEQDCPDICMGNGNTLDLGDIRSQLVFEQLAPRVVVLDGFMNKAECDLMCALAEPLMSDAKVMSSTSLQGNVHKDVRDANTAHMSDPSHPFVKKIEQRISRLTGWDSARGEALQIQRYTVHGKYIPHYDFFHRGSVSEERALAIAGQRLATLIVYLREPEAGGATYLANLGIKVYPRSGTALFFSYPEATKQSGTLHGGDPVMAGEKWILTKWFRQRPCPAPSEPTQQASLIVE